MRTTLVLPTLLALMACRPQPPQPPVTDEPVADQPTPTPAPEQVVEDEPTVHSDTVKLSPLRGSATVNVTVGTTLRYSFKSHASVGYGATQQCSDESVVRYVKTDTEYEQSEADRAGKTGADAATGTFVFEAIAAGTATVTVDEQFRGTSETTTTFTIVVSD
ncbi:hypothetical protein [Enhygromyxa salina]|uniref:Proteinase inhibitor I42 chagasin domain-containing protein n=1 Tax=Enhygromyxa salina TaxID=215803 RepID=A0A2S9XT61_9BACT|nr:hypothetical protein [Enhygromyxa salina]PRP96033.1 hypothetical protein ENSA7_68470 [Enhygromyxa salina]